MFNSSSITWLAGHRPIVASVTASILFGVVLGRLSVHHDFFGVSVPSNHGSAQVASVPALATPKSAAKNATATRRMRMPRAPKAPSDNAPITTETQKLYAIIDRLDPTLFAAFARRVNQQPNSDDRYSLHRFLTRRWVETHPENALEYVYRVVKQGQQHVEILDAAVDVFSEVDPALMVEWLADRDVDPLYDYITKRLADNIASPGAANLIALINQGADQSLGVSRAIASHLVASQPRTAVRMIDRLHPKIQVAIAGQMAGTLAVGDQDTAVHWYKSRARADLREAALSGLVNYYATDEPEKAFYMAAWSRGGERLALLQLSIERLANFNPHAVTRAIDTALLSPDERAALAAQWRMF